MPKDYTRSEPRDRTWRPIMNPELAPIIEAMERGWKMCPRQAKYKTHEGDDPCNPTACCSMGHYNLGASGRASHSGGVPDVFYIPVKGYVALIDAIVALNNWHNWTTPRIIEWLRTLP